MNKTELIINTDKITKWDYVCIWKFKITLTKRYWTRFTLLVEENN